MGGTSTLAKSFCFLGARALSDRQRLHFGQEELLIRNLLHVIADP